ncbi:MAG: hypothetical protein H6Q89_4168 [Myxococcaceae bacterium]|nr:hypothetical protein [Myxococcaceae bacterium]
MPVPLVLLTLVLSADPAADAGAPIQPTPWPVEAAPSDGAPSSRTQLKLRGAAEVGLTSFPSGFPGGTQDALLDLRPVLGLDLGEDFALELGAELRMRLVDNPPEQRSTDFGGVLRRADWDEPSDFGQILHALRVGNPAGFFWLEAGAVRKRTLGLGHLLWRYSNQDNPDYHPAAATVGAGYKAFRGELFASDLFGARIFAGEAVADFGRIFGSSEGAFDRFHLAVSAAHDAGRAGSAAAPVTLLQLDLDAVFYRSSALRLMVLAGAGGRTADLLDPTADVGLLAGLAADLTLPRGFSIGGRVELRKQQSGFRPGFLGPGYELARFSGTGFSQPARAAEQLPDGFSVAGELHLAHRTTVSLDAALEYFSWGRADVDGLFSLELLDHRLVAGARYTGTGLGQVPRHAVTGELRARIVASFYVIGSGGTVFFPQTDGSLVRGIYAGAGAGIDFDFER